MKILELLIDDDPIMNFVNQRMVKKYDLAQSPQCFEAARDALEMIRAREQEYDVIFILLDINMPDMSGWQFLNELEALSPCLQEKLQVVMLTSSIAEEDLCRSKRYTSVKHYMTKPLTANKCHDIKNLSLSNAPLFMHE